MRDAKRQLLEAGRPITADAIKAIVTGNKDKDRMLIGIFSDYNDKIEKLIGIDYSKATWTKYDRTKRFTADFIRWKYKAPDIVINRLDMEFINDFEFWLKTERKCCQNTTAKYISILKMIVLHCVSHDWLAKDPFARYEIVKEEVIPQYLTKEEIHAIVYIPDHVDPPFRIMLTHHSGMLTHPDFHVSVDCFSCIVLKKVDNF